MADPKRMTIKFDVSDVIEEIDSYPKTTQKAIVSAVNIVGRKANTMIKKKVKKDYNVNTATLSRNVKVVPARRRNTFVTFFVIVVKNNPRGLIKFGARETTSGVTATVERAGRRNIPRAFIGNYRKGKTGPNQGDFVMIRSKRKHVTRFTRKGTPYQSETRRTLYGLTIAQMYITKPNLKLFGKVMDEDFEDTLNEKFNQFAK